MAFATRPIRPANPFARAAGAVPLCEESQTWRLQAEIGKRAKCRHVPTAMARGAAFAEPCYRDPSVKNSSRPAATSDRLSDNASRMCGIELIGAVSASLHRDRRTGRTASKRWSDSAYLDSAYLIEQQKCVGTRSRPTRFMRSAGRSSVGCATSDQACLSACIGRGCTDHGAGSSSLSASPSAAVSWILPGL
jgi:hypothetical protein